MYEITYFSLLLPYKCAPNDSNISFNPITNKANVLSNNKNKKLVLSENPF